MRVLVFGDSGYTPEDEGIADGSSIAISRTAEAENSGIYLIPPTGGSGLEIMQNVDLELRLSRKTCVVVCPTAKLPAEVKLDTSLGLESCSRQSEYGDCAQTCAPEIESSSESLEDFVAIWWPQVRVLRRRADGAGLVQQPPRCPSD